MRQLHYDRQGNAISSKRAAELHTESYARVALSELPNGVIVSTVWLPWDHRTTLEGPPLIFETLVSGAQRDWDLTSRTHLYSTEAAALAGHNVIVAQLQQSN